MDVTKLTPPGAAAVRAPTTSSADAGLQSPVNIAAIADRADIRPLDIPAGLRILLAEVRASFVEQGLLMSGDDGVALEDPSQAARALVDVAMQSLPDVDNVATWTATLLHVETALQTGLERGIGAVTVWRDVPATVVDATQETRALVVSVFGEEPQNPIWLRPEWAGLAPRFERFWRRRCLARRRLTDPDYSSGGFDDCDEHRS